MSICYECWVSNLFHKIALDILVSIDAMGCQKSIAKEIVAKRRSRTAVHWTSFETRFA